MAATVEDSRMPFHIAYKVPLGDGLYVQAKHAQLVERDPEKAVSLFRASLQAGDRVDSALKDLAIVLKQLNRPLDAICAISSFRSRCSENAQDSLDNILLDLYKSSGRLDDQVALLIRKLRAYEQSHSFNGKRTKTARSQGKKFQVSVEQEVARLLGNLGWAYMQQLHYKDAESVYRRSLAIAVDGNQACNLVVCLLKQGKAEEAISVLRGAAFINKKGSNLDFQQKSHDRAQELMRQASAMLNSTKCIDRSDKRSGLAGASSMQAEVEAHRHCRQSNEGTDGSYFPACTMSILPLDAPPANATRTENSSSETMSKSMADSWMLGCNHNQSDLALGHESTEKQESNNQSMGFDIREDNHFSLQTSLWMSHSSTSLRNHQIHAQNRRLPVFRDITSLGEAAA